jgi:hypothetical protein
MELLVVKPYSLVPVLDEGSSTVQEGGPRRPISKRRSMKNAPIGMKSHDMNVTNVT